MNARLPHEPSRHFPEPQRLWDNLSRHPQSLGCSTCLERDRCGGVHTDAGIFDCSNLCTCADKSECDMVCRFNRSLYVARMREVRGLDFDTAPRTSANGVPTMPMVVPFVDHRYSRAAVLDESVVALSLYELVNLATGKLHVTSRAELAARFLIPEAAQVIVSGVAKDGPIERWWSLEDRESLLAALNELGITAATTPNYSVLNDVPRTDNLHAMKRILLTWTEMASAGLATALHVNGRTGARLSPVGRPYRQATGDRNPGVRVRQRMWLGRAHRLACRPALRARRPGRTPACGCYSRRRTKAR